MKLSHEWATPITIGAFGLMAVTGLLMFFHSDIGLNKAAHEWLGWLMVAGVGLHTAVHWRAFKRYFVSSATGRGILVAFALILIASFAPVAGKSAPPPVMAMNAIARAPISAVAPLTGRPAETLVKQLQKAGLAVSGPDSSIASAAGDNRELQAKAMSVLFAGKLTDRISQ